MAPGSLVLGAWPPNSKINKGLRNRAPLLCRYNVLSGTSIACPHASGVAALLKGAHPQWSPTAIRSAIMTTADPYDNTHSPIKDNRNNSIASPSVMGAGKIRPNQALDPVLIYDATPQDYVNLLCSTNFTEKQIESFTGSKNYNCSSPSFDFNYPAFVLCFNNYRTSIVQKFQGTVTNVGEGAATYQVTMKTPVESKVMVSPDIDLWEEE